MNVRYFVDDFKTNLIKEENNKVYSYDFKAKKWNRSDYWFNEIIFECAINCDDITEEEAQKIMERGKIN